MTSISTEFFLPQKVSDTLDEWMASPDFGCWSGGGWIKAREGQIYCRYTPAPSDFRESIDLAIFEIGPKWRGKGIARKIISMTCAKDIPIVRIENIINIGWSKVLQHYEFEGRETIVSGDPEWLTVDYVQI